MKSISNELSNHLDGEVTTLASCWRVVRRDGREFYFTDHDRDIVFEGNSYEAAASYNRTAVSNGSDLSVDNMDVAGILDSATISEEDMRNGLFNRADVYVFIVNWADPSQGPLRVRRGWFGEVMIDDTGQFTTEIRGLAQALSHNFIEVYSAECRADFCDTRCKLNIADFEKPGTVSDKGDGRSIFTGTDIPEAPTVGTSVGAHRYWSIKPTSYPSGSDFFMSEVRFRDQAGNLITGGTAKDNVPDKESFLGIGFLGNGRQSISPKNMRDGNFTSEWGFSSGWNNRSDDDTDIPIEDVRWWIEFPNAVDIAQIEIIATNRPDKTPTAFTISYMDTKPDDDYIDQVWTPAKECTFNWTTAGQSAVWGFGSSGTGPINYASAPQPLPAPTAGVSTYVGGTIRWLTGKNAGRIVEILGYGGGTVTLFEAMSYPIEVGDTFIIAQGCDGSLARCKLYDNVINRRAEDYIPGNDELMKYPDAK